MSGPNTSIFDLKARTVIPGLINTHIHINDEAETDYGMEIGYEGIMAYPIDWNGVTTTQDVLNQVEGLLEKFTFQPGEWIYFASAGGSNDRSVKIMIDGLNRWELDKVTPDNPIVMGMTWPNVNGVVVNSKALDIIWAEHGDFFETYGRYWVNEDGEPEGHLESPGLRFALEYLPTPPPEKMGPIFKLASRGAGCAGCHIVFHAFAPICHCRLPVAGIQRRDAGAACLWAGRLLRSYGPVDGHEGCGCKDGHRIGQVLGDLGSALGH